MFCPSCGLEDKQSNQFCRACGADLRVVRSALARPDDITESATAARDEIGRAVAAKIREMDSARDLTRIAEDVLPQIEKFLESPEQRRLRRCRVGLIVCGAGVGVSLLFLLMALREPDALFLIGAGFITIFVGLAIILNGYLFTVPSKAVPNNSLAARNQRELDAKSVLNGGRALPASNEDYISVTENTTRHLEEKQFVPRD